MAEKLIAPAQPPLPTTRNLPFHASGIQSSMRIAEPERGVSAAATRQCEGSGNSGADRCSTVASLRCSAAVIAMACLGSWRMWGHAPLQDAAATNANAGAAHQRVALIIAIAESPFRSCSCPIRPMRQLAITDDIAERAAQVDDSFS